MKRLATAATIAALLGSPVSAGAWWGAPGWGNSWNDWWNDFFGDASFDLSFSMSASGRGRGWDRWTDHYGRYPYWGGPWGYGYPVHGYPYAGPVVPVAPVPAQAK